MSVYLVIFGKPRYLGLMKMQDEGLKAGKWVVIKTVRGMEMGVLGGILTSEQESKYRIACLEDTGEEQTKGPEPMLQDVEFVEVASPEQLTGFYQNRLEDDNILVRSRQILREHALQMKLVDVEYMMDHKKLFFYFTSEQRIDFRAYVRDLAKEFRIRIEMRQIGVRDEAKSVRGIGPCGRPCCCSYWLHRFTPICVRMVKEQNLALTPTKISGICGRLMCCMAYEHTTYNELWKSLPNPGSKVKTANGNYLLEGLNLSAETITIRSPEGREFPVPVAEFNDFKETVLRGDTWDTGEPEDPFHRLLPLSRKATIRGKQVREALPKVDRRPKAEKISLDDHLAGKVAKVREPRRSDESSDTQLPAKKRSRRHRSKSTTPQDMSRVSVSSDSVVNDVASLERHDAGMQQRSDRRPHRESTSNARSGSDDQRRDERASANRRQSNTAPENSDGRAQQKRIRHRSRRRPSGEKGQPTQENRSSGNVEGA